MPFHFKFGDESDFKRIKVDWIPIGGDFIRKPLYAEKINGIWVATMPSMAILKAKSISPNSQRTPEQRVNDMTDFKFLLKSIGDAKQKIPDELKQGGFLLWNAVNEDQEVKTLLQTVWPGPPVTEIGEGMWF